MFIRDMLQIGEGFTQGERLVADYFLSKGNAIANQSTRHIADALYLSAPSVVRLCQKLGFAGFNEFKRSYLDELAYVEQHFQGVDANEPFEERDDIMRVASKLSALHRETAEDTMSILNRDDLAYATRLLLRAYDIVVCAVGPQYHLACIFQSWMASIGYSVHVSHSMNDTFMRACYADETTCFMFISYSGESELTLRVAQKVAERGLPAFAITSLGSNSLSRLISHTLHVTTREHLRGTVAPFASTESMMLLLNVLYACAFNAHHAQRFGQRQLYAKEFEPKRISDNPILVD